MRGRVFLFLFIILLAAGGSAPLLRPLLATPPPPTATATVTPTSTVTPSPTTDPFAHVPTATPQGAALVSVIQPLPSPSWGEAPPTFTPAPTFTSTPILPVILPDTAPPATSSPQVMLATLEPISIPTPAGSAPSRLQIPRLNLDAPVEPATLIPSTTVAGVYEWEVPAYRAAGWLNTSAPFGMAGNTVLDGHHNIEGEVFRDLWALQAGDEIVLWSGEQARRYRVSESVIVPERDQPLEVRLANAQYIQPTADERLTLITCYPYDDNSHRAIVVARPINNE